MRKQIIPLLIAAILLVSSGCQKTPEKSIVTSKNDGTFEAALENTPATAPTTAPENTDAAAETQTPSEATTYTDNFENANGTIQYELTLAAPSVQTALPVIQVRPMEITSETAEQTARAIFGDAEIYEYSTEHTKAELETTILDLKQSISDWDALVTMCGGDEDAANEYKSLQEEQISRIEEAYATAPDTVDKALCDWQFHPGSYYSDSTDGAILDNGQQMLKASVTVNGVPYTYTVMNRESSDFREHYIEASPSEEFTSWDSLYADTGTPVNGDAVKAKAIEIANSMGIGQWQLGSYYEDKVSNNNSRDAASVTRIALVKVYDGLPMTRHDGPYNEVAYGPQYSYEKMDMTFNGESLVDFYYQGALEKVDTVNGNIQTLPFTDILAAAKTQMQLLGTTNPVTGEAIPATEDGSYEKIVVDGVQLGLSRIFIKDNTTEYYLVPTYTFYGTSTSYNADGSLVDFSVTDEASGQTITVSNERAVELAVINAVDGSAVDTNLGY